MQTEDSPELAERLHFALTRATRSLVILARKDTILSKVSVQSEARGQNSAWKGFMGAFSEKILFQCKDGDLANLKKVGGGETTSKS